MCIEDIRIGGKRYAKKVTAIAGGATVNFAGDSRRIAIRLVYLAVSFDTAGAIKLFRTSDGATLPIAVVNSSLPVDDLTKEIHGNLLNEQLTAISTTTAGTLVEILLDDQQNPPITGQ